MAKTDMGSVLGVGVLLLGGYFLYKNGVFSGAKAGQPATPQGVQIIGAPNVPFAFSAPTSGIGNWASIFNQTPSSPGAVEAGGILYGASSLSNQPYVLTDGNGNPIPGVT